MFFFYRFSWALETYLFIYCEFLMSIAKDLCFQAAETGDCQNYTARWYFDTKDELCRQFYYGGCGGNENNFADETSCLARCEIKADVTTIAPRQQQQPSEKFRTEHCFLEQDAGSCRTRERRWYYNKAEGICELFAYGGCEGNQNNFMTEGECEQNCGNAQETCGLPPVYGRCDENTTRWYYDGRSAECVEFTFSGCQGNKNNFYTNAECLNQCQTRQVPPHKEEPRTQGPELDNVC